MKYIQRTYSDLIKIETYAERLEYLYIGDKIGLETFGVNRRLNQVFYTSSEWLRARDRVIARDMGCDLGVEGCELEKRNIFVHHINPITEDDIVNRHPKLTDPENLITSSRSSHNHIHFGTKVESEYTPRTPNDTTLWRVERR